MAPVSALLLLLQISVPIVTVVRGATSQIMEPRQVVVRTAAEWQSLWREHSEQPLPAGETVDFTRFMIAGLFAGSRPTAGYSVEITSVTARDGEIILDYVERQPPSDAITAQVITSPFHIVRIPISPGRVVFRRATP
jgi:hypothetical protein